MWVFLVSLDLKSGIVTRHLECLSLSAVVMSKSNDLQLCFIPAVVYLFPSLIRPCRFPSTKNREQEQITGLFLASKERIHTSEIATK